MSTSTVLSSVESLPPTTSVEGLPRVPEQTAEEQSTKEEGRAEMEEKNDGKIDKYYNLAIGYMKLIYPKLFEFASLRHF